MRPIPIRPDLKRAVLESEDLIRLAHLLSGSLKLECPQCRTMLKPTVANRELRLGSSPDLSALDPSQPSRPRLVFFCVFCSRQLGFLQGDVWTKETREDGAEGTRWSHLEIEEN